MRSRPEPELRQPIQTALAASGLQSYEVIAALRDRNVAAQNPGASMILHQIAARHWIIAAAIAVIAVGAFALSWS